MAALDKRPPRRKDTLGYVQDKNEIFFKEIFPYIGFSKKGSPYIGKKGFTGVKHFFKPPAKGIWRPFFEDVKEIEMVDKPSRKLPQPNRPAKKQKRNEVLKMMEDAMNKGKVAKYSPERGDVYVERNPDGPAKCWDITNTSRGKGRPMSWF